MAKILGKIETPNAIKTGGGVVKVFLSLAIMSQLLAVTEALQLDDAPLCVPMGDIVQKQRMAFIWSPGRVPFHVTNINKLEISCPQKVSQRHQTC